MWLELEVEELGDDVLLELVDEEEGLEVVDSKMIEKHIIKVQKTMKQEYYIFTGVIIQQ